VADWTGNGHRTKDDTRRRGVVKNGSTIIEQSGLRADYAAAGAAGALAAGAGATSGCGVAISGGTADTAGASALMGRRGAPGRSLGFGGDAGAGGSGLRPVPSHSRHGFSGPKMPPKYESRTPSPTHFWHLGVDGTVPVA